jgi:hypothetical protein
MGTGTLIPTVVVCGGRDFNDYLKLCKALNTIFYSRGWILEPDEYGNWLPNVRIVAGGAPGADTLSIDYAVCAWCESKEYPADWDTHGLRAGPIRNQEMLDKEDVKLVVAFPMPKSKGTWDMVRRARKAGVEVIVIE